MPRKPTLSPSKISTFLACPHKFYWTYLNEMGRYFLRSKSYFSFGTSLHRVLQRFHDSGDSGVQTASQAAAALEEGWIDAGYQTPEQMMEAQGEGKVILESYIENFNALNPEATPLLIEKMLRYDMGDFVLRGKLDRLDEHPDGLLEIVDYKSGRTEVTADEIEDDLAMSVYQLLVKRNYPNRPVTATIIALRTLAKASASLDDARLAEFEQDILKIGQTILEFESREAGTKEPSTIPQSKSLCASCDFLSLCQKRGLTLPEPAAAPPES
ncbi:MAG: PD-(D/E)XK nuclease family protein [Chthonomonas sp.]|nr:PD-(D/E)XK nuclease family protein [Chthonomonas sp.]